MVENRSVNIVLLLNLLVTIPVAHALTAGLVSAIEQLPETHSPLYKTTSQDAVSSIGDTEINHLVP